MENHNHTDHHEDCTMHNMNHVYNPNHLCINDKVSYNDKIGTVTRNNILGMKLCCAFEITWDDESREIFIRERISLLNKVN